MRVDGRKLPLSTVPLYQLFPCHLGPPRPTLSINLYVKGCLDCTIGAFHMSIPSESSLISCKLSPQEKIKKNISNCHLLKFFPSLLSINPYTANHNNCRLLCHLLVILKVIFAKQCGPRSDCSSRSSLIWVHTVCLYAKIGLKVCKNIQQTT